MIRLQDVDALQHGPSAVGIHKQRVEGEEHTLAPCSRILLTDPLVALGGKPIGTVGYALTPFDDETSQKILACYSKMLSEWEGDDRLTNYFETLVVEMVKTLNADTVNRCSVTPTIISPHAGTT